MRPIVSREQSRAFDRHAIEACGVPGLILMENAGRGATDAIVRRLPALSIGRGARALVLCGSGNNGGDGFVVARHLLREEFAVDVALLCHLTELTGDASVNCQAFRGLGGSVVEVVDERCAALDPLLAQASFTVDAIFGTGLSREVTGHFEQAIAKLNRLAAPCFALDVPSGLDAQTGAVLGSCVRAQVTVSFAHPTLGLLTNTGAAQAGELEVVDIGVPSRLVHHSGHSAWLVEEKDVAELMATIKRPSHKGQAGRVGIVAGSPGTIGAAQLVARGAFRAGAGLVTIASQPEAISHLESDAWETMTCVVSPDDPVGSLCPLLEGCDAITVGPGLGLGSVPISLTESLVGNFPGTLVMDADALTHLAGRASLLASPKGRLILTPHPGEAARLLGVSSRDVEADRFKAVSALVDATQAVVLLKGIRTIVAAPGIDPVVNDSGNAALATAGSGDVLAGIIAALCCSLPPREAATAGAFLHGLVAEAWTAKHGPDRGMLAREIADGLPRVIAGLESGVLPYPDDDPPDDRLRSSRLPVGA